MNEHATPYQKPSLFRYLAVMIYDSLLLLSVLILASAIAVAINSAITNNTTIESGNVIFCGYLLLVSFLFYGWFWTHGGQTLGMRCWKVHLISASQQRIGWFDALLRFTGALVSWIPLGLGFWWLYLSYRNQSWLDILSGTHLHFKNKSPQD